MSNKQIPEEIRQKIEAEAKKIFPILTSEKYYSPDNDYVYEGAYIFYRAKIESEQKKFINGAEYGYQLGLSHPPQQGSAEDRKKRVAEIYEENRPSFRDWGTLKDMCIATAIQYADEYAATQPSGEAGAVESFLTSTIRSNGSQTDISKAAKLLKEHLLTIKNKGK